MIPKNCNGWSIFYHPLFVDRYTKLEAKVLRLKADLPDKKFRHHETTKLYAAIVKIIEEKIPKEPLSQRFRLDYELADYCRVRDMGLDERHRLFFIAFESEKLIIILWLGYPRKKGSKDDCYEVFKDMVAKGYFPATPEELLKECAGEDIL